MVAPVACEYHSYFISSLHTLQVFQTQHPNLAHRQGGVVKQCQISKGKPRVLPQAGITPGTSTCWRLTVVELGRKSPGSQVTMSQH